MTIEQHARAAAADITKAACERYRPGDMDPEAIIKSYTEIIAKHIREATAELEQQLTDSEKRAADAEQRRAIANDQLRGCSELLLDLKWRARAAGTLDRRQVYDECALRLEAALAATGPQQPTEPQLIYLASPYSHDDTAIRDARFHEICRHAARLMSEGHLIFSPIAHTHPIAMAGALPTGFDFWERYDRAQLAAAGELWVVKMDGWDKSKGVKAEIEIATQLGKPVRYIEPNAPATTAAEVPIERASRPVPGGGSRYTYPLQSGSPTGEAVKAICQLAAESLGRTFGLADEKRLAEIIESAAKPPQVPAGKTPGQVAYQAYYPESESEWWHKEDESVQAAWEAAAQAVRSMVGEPRWITPAERLPENQQNVLFVVASHTNDDFYFGRMLGGRYVADGFSGFGVPGLAFGDCVTHWMPMPEPPPEQPATKQSEVRNGSV